jgi:hypothetical protein
MTDRKQNQNQPNPNQQKNPQPSRDDQKWDEAAGTGSQGRERSTEEPASVAEERGNPGERNRRTLDGDLDEGQQESGMNDPVSDTNRNRDRGTQNPDRNR